jgi:hypothetical protein
MVRHSLSIGLKHSLSIGRNFTYRRYSLSATKAVYCINEIEILASTILRKSQVHLQCLSCRQMQSWSHTVQLVDFRMRSAAVVDHPLGDAWRWKTGSFTSCLDFPDFLSAGQSRPSKPSVLCLAVSPLASTACGRRRFNGGAVWPSDLLKACPHFQVQQCPSKQQMARFKHYCTRANP